MTLVKENLVKGKIYRIRSRNLSAGVFDGNDGFIGIREKFGSRYLFKEYLAREFGGTYLPFDTVTPLEEIDLLPTEIPIVESIGTICSECGKPAWWTGPPAPAPWACESGCEKVAGYSQGNKELFKYLEEIERGTP